MTERPKPLLAPVPPPQEPGPGDAAEAPDRDRFWQRHGVRLGVALLVLALLVCSGALVGQIRHARGLEARVRALAESLAAAEAELDARRGHLDAVRGGVVRVRDELDALSELANRDPASGPPGPRPGAD